jgi:hypothetical protein
MRRCFRSFHLIPADLCARARHSGHETFISPWSLPVQLANDLLNARPRPAYDFSYFPVAKSSRPQQHYFFVP